MTDCLAPSLALKNKNYQLTLGFRVVTQHCDAFGPQRARLDTTIQYNEYLDTIYIKCRVRDNVLTSY